jgi:hypothetical protein
MEKQRLNALWLSLELREEVMAAAEKGGFLRLRY